MVLLLCLAALSAGALPAVGAIPAAGEYRGPPPYAPLGPSAAAALPPGPAAGDGGAVVSVRVLTPAPGRGDGDSGGGDPVLSPGLWSAWGQRPHRPRRGAEAAERSGAPVTCGAAGGGTGLAWARPDRRCSVGLVGLDALLSAVPAF